jgi:hypothetical protein
MDHKIDTRRIDKRAAKKGRDDGPYTAKHIRVQEQNLKLSTERSTLGSSAATVSGSKAGTSGSTSGKGKKKK